MADDQRFAVAIRRARKRENILIEHHSQSAELVDELCAQTGQSLDDLSGPDGYKLAVYKAAEIALYNVIHEVWGSLESAQDRNSQGSLELEEAGLLIAIGTNGAPDNPDNLSVLAALSNLVGKGLVQEISLEEVRRGETMELTEAGKIVFSLLSS